MTDIKLNVLTRSKENDKIKLMRADGLIPAVIYGSGVKTRHLKIKLLDFERIFEQAGESNLIDLTIDNENPAKVIIKDIQRNAVSDKAVHVDLYQVDMNKKITTEIPLNFIDSSKAVSAMSGILVKNIDAIKVECLPGNLVDHIDVSLSALENLNDAIKIADLNLPPDMAVINEPNMAVASVVEQAKEEEVQEAEEAEEGIAEEGKTEETKEENRPDEKKEKETKSDNE